MYSSSGDLEIGETLRKARQDSGFTLDDIELETKIRKRYLEALEREDYEELPSAVYARGFLKTYANYLGLDGEELSQELKSRWSEVQERQREEFSPKNERVRQRPRSRSAGGGIPGRRRISPFAVLGFVLMLVLLAAAVGGLYWVGQSSRSVQEIPDRQSGQASGDNGEQMPPGGTSKKDGTSADQGSRNATASPPDNEVDAGRTEVASTPPPPEVIRMIVKVEQVPAWLNVQTDGNVAYEQVAQPGFSQDFEAGQQISVWTGDAGAVRLEINGQDYGALGAPGEVKRRIFALKPAER